MADVRAVLRVTDELLWVLRRAGFEIATSQAVDAVRAVRAVGLESRVVLRDALAAVVVKRARDRQRFDSAFDAFFSGPPRRTLWERLAAEGFTSAELDALREQLDAIASSSKDGALLPLLHRGAELDRLLQLAGSARLLDGMQSALQTGFYLFRLLDHVGTWRAHDALGHLRGQLAGALGEERAEALTRALRREVESAAADVRAFVSVAAARRDADRSKAADVMHTPFVSLDEAEVEEVRRAVRAFVERLRGGQRVRLRLSRRGRIDGRATMRSAMRTGGVPLRIVRRARRRDKPRLVLLCDVSDSVRSVARFLLELAYAAQDLFERTRTFIFVSDLGETTRLFAEEPLEVALAAAYSGAIVAVTHNSNYGRVLQSFSDRVLRDVDRRTTVVVLGDGRTNYQADGADVLDAVRARARDVIWLCPEPRTSWATGDSAMPRYAKKCTRVIEVLCARDLEDAARFVLARR